MSHLRVCEASKDSTQARPPKGRCSLGAAGVVRFVSGLVGISAANAVALRNRRGVMQVNHGLVWFW